MKCMSVSDEITYNSEQLPKYCLLNTACSLAADKSDVKIVQGQHAMI